MSTRNLRVRNALAELQRQAGLMNFERDFEQQNFGKIVLSESPSLNLSAGRIVPEVVQGSGDAPAAVLEVTVTRLTDNIAEDLPYVLFGPSMADSLYVDQITDLTTDRTAFDYTSFQSGNTVATAKTALFTFTNPTPDPDEVDTIRVQVTSGSYNTALKALIYENWDIVGWQTECNDPDNAANVFAQPLRIYQQTGFGKFVSNDIPVTLNAFQNQQTVRDFSSQRITLNKITGIGGRLPAFAGISVKYTFNVARYIR